MLFTLSFRERNVGGSVVPGLLSMENGATGQEAEDYLAIATRIVLMTHGFNVSLEKGKSSLQKLANFLNLTADAAMVSVLWPGDHQLGVISYPAEGRDADDSATQLVRFLDRVTSKYARPPVSLVAHSLGCRLVLETAKQLTAGGWVIDQACLMAAAVNDYSLAADRDYLDACEAALRVGVLASRKDYVLRLAYPIGNAVEGFLFSDQKLGKALGYHGPRADKKSGQSVPDTVHAVVIKNEHKVGHGDYLPFWDALPSREQRAAATFASQLLQGVTNPSYEIV